MGSYQKMRIPRPQDKIYLKNNPQFSRESGCKPCKVENFVLGVVFVRPYRGRELLEVTCDDLDYCCDEVLTSEEKRKMINDYVKIERLKTPKDWNIEVGYINKLESMYPSIEFWRNFNIDYKVQSFCFFLGGGKEQIIKKYREFTVDLEKTKSNTKLSSAKLGEDVVIKKQLNLFE
jgi:hypothetical protein